MSQDIHSFPGENTAKIRGFVNRYLPYLPLIVGCLAIGILGAFLTLRYSHFVYETKAKVILAIDENKAKDDKSGVLSLKLDNNTSSPEEKAFELFQSKENMTLVVKKLDLYAEIVSSGRFIKKPSYGVGSPLLITSPYPDSINQDTYLELQLRPDLKTIYLSGISYPTGRLVHTPFGWYRFDFQPKFINRTGENKYELHLIPPTILASQILGRIRFVAKNAPSNIFEIYIQDEIPDRSKAIVPTMIQVYDSLSSVKQREANVNIIKFIDQRLDVVSDELNQIETELQNFKSTFKTDNLQMEGSSYFSKTQEIDKEISGLNNQEKILDEIDSYLNKSYSGTKELPSLVELNNPTMTQQIVQLFDLESQLEKQNKISGKKNPQTLYLQERISVLKPAILGSIQNLKKNYQISQRNLNTDLDHYNALLKEVPNQERKLLDITRKQEAKNAIYTYLLQKKEEVSINSAAIFPNTQILEKADRSKLVAPVVTQVYLLYILGSLAIGILLVALIEALDNSIKSRSDIERVLQTPIIGEISRIGKFEQDRPIVIGKGIKSIPAEQFRSLRTNLSYLGLDGEHKVILMTSSIMKEGKSFLILNIAISIALSGKKILLMDFDLRKPKISSQFIPDYSPGITNFLVGSTNNIRDIIYEIPDYPNLFVIPSGAIPPNPSEIILGKRMNALMDTVREEFEYIMIDSPPVGIVTDAKLLAQYVDISLYAIRQGTTPKMFLRTIEKLDSEKFFPNLGIIINDIRKTQFNEYGYTYEYAYDMKSKSRWGILEFFKKLFQR